MLYREYTLAMNIMDIATIDLLQWQKVSSDEVIEDTKQRKFATAWSQRTNDSVVNYLGYLTEQYQESWYQGFLDQETFLSIRLPKHSHVMIESAQDHVLFPEECTVGQSGEYFRNADPVLDKHCVELIGLLKEEIRNEGFITNLIIKRDSEGLHHVDGLHRMVALCLLLEEGWSGGPIPVFLFDSK